MSKGKDKDKQMPGKNEISIVRSSAAEYLTFVAAGGSSEASVEMRYEDENLWLTQKMMAALYDVSVPAINQHLKRFFADNELERKATVKSYLIVQNEGNREVRRDVEHYNLQAIIAIGFKIENERAVQFRKWANQIVKDYTIQGWTMDVERLKRGGNLTDEFFERQLEKIREIRLSERKFYQKITDIYATALDYDPSATAIKRFFAAVQNKLNKADPLAADRDLRTFGTLGVSRHELHDRGARFKLCKFKPEHNPGDIMPIFQVIPSPVITAITSNITTSLRKTE